MRFSHVNMRFFSQHGVLKKSHVNMEHLFLMSFNKQKNNKQNPLSKLSVRVRSSRGAMRSAPKRTPACLRDEENVLSGDAAPKTESGLPTTASNGAGTGMRSEGDTEMAQPITVLGVKIWPSTLREAIVSFDPPLDPQPKNWLEAGKGDVPKKQRESERRLVHPVHVSHHVFACSLSPCLMYQLAHVRVAKG